MDGEWEPPMIPNPEYKVGWKYMVMRRTCILCGRAFSQQSFNTAFVCTQGEWKPKQIDNPNYKGAWVHPEIDNPEYSADSTIYKFDSVSVLGLDLWQVREWTISYE